MSYANFILYGAVIPNFGKGKGKDGEGDDESGEEVVSADDPANWEMLKQKFRERRKHGRK